MTSLKNATLTLFFTRRVGLRHWDAVGNLNREIAVYLGLADQLQRINFITYGGEADLAYQAQISPIQLYATPARLPVPISRLLLQTQYSSILHHSDILKTNQIPGTELAIWAKKRFDKKLIVRCGYLYSRFMESHSSMRWRVQRAYNLERTAFSTADVGVVTSERDRAWVIDTHKVAPEKIHVIPNYVLTDLFKPMPNELKRFDLVCIAKAAPQKNLTALLHAIIRLKGQGDTVSLLLIGSAAQDMALHQLAKEAQLAVTFLSRVPNFELPIYLNQARLFILPSHYEGHPKALLEAMSCGLPCIGTNVPGIKEDLRHEQTGYLCQTNPESIAQAIHVVRENTQLRQKLGSNARRHIEEKYSLSRSIELELNLISRIL